MVFFEAIHSLVNLDIGFFIDILMGNLLWIFIIYAMIHFFTNGKRTFYFFVLFSLVIWAFLDFDVLTGMTWTAASFLVLLYMTKLALFAWAENSEYLKNKLFLLSEVHFVILILFFTFFLK